MKQRFRDRIAAIFAVTLLVGLAGGTYYLAEFGGFDQSPRRGPLRHEPDYFVDGLAMIRLNARGEPVFRMSAARMQHYADDGTTVFEAPRLVSLDPTRPTVRLRSRTARTDRDGRSTDLMDDVVLVREATDRSPKLVVETDFITIDSDTEIARTTHPVRIQRGETTLTGVGMEFNNAARQLRLDSDVHGVWRSEPATPTPARTP